MKNYCKIIKEKTNITPSTILEIGSLHGDDANILKTEFNLSENDVWIVEPNPEEMDKIKIKYPDFNFISNPIFNKKGTHEFYQVIGDDAGTSSLFDRSDSWYELHGNGLKKLNLETITGEDLLNLINKEIDLCKIDVEGLSFEVLVSFGSSINLIKSLHIECEHREVWKNQKLYDEVSKYLQSKNYLELYFKYVADDTLQSDSIWINKKFLI